MKKLAIALSLALIAILCFSTVALAWDYEDPCVAGNDDFIAGGGQDNGTWETQSGGQPWPYGKNPNDGYSLYRDDVTDTGNLDSAFILTFTPDEVGLPIIAKYWHPDIGYYWYMGDMSPNTWYWATAPRGFNAYVSPGDIHQAYAGKFMVDMIADTSFASYNWVEPWNQGETLAEPVSQTITYNHNSESTVYKIEIPAGTEIVGYYGGYAHFLKFEVIGGEFYFSPNLKFSQPVVLYELVGEEWVEVLSFTEVFNGKVS